MKAIAVFTARIAARNSELIRRRCCRCGALGGCKQLQSADLSVWSSEQQKHNKTSFFRKTDDTAVDPFAPYRRPLLLWL